MNLYIQPYLDLAGSGGGALEGVVEEHFLGTSRLENGRSNACGTRPKETSKEKASGGGIPAGGRESSQY